MALIQCPECGKEVSDHAETCVHCGYPIKNSPEKEESSVEIQETKVQKERKPVNKRKLWIIVTAVILSVVLIGLGVYSILENKKYSRNFSAVIDINFHMTKADVIEYERKVYGNTAYEYDERVNRLDFELTGDDIIHGHHMYFFDHEKRLFSCL